MLDEDEVLKLVAYVKSLADRGGAPVTAPDDRRRIGRETPAERASYLRAGHTLRSWLLTTDHKRIAILYLSRSPSSSSSAAPRPR